MNVKSAGNPNSRGSILSRRKNHIPATRAKRRQQKRLILFRRPSGMDAYSFSSGILSEISAQQIREER
jgi:hypothetical protein